MKVKVIIEEHIVEEFLIEAADEGEATEKAIADYESGKITLDRNNVAFRLMSVDDSEWFEF